MPNTRSPLLAPLPELEAARAATESGSAAPVAPDDEPVLVALVVLTGDEDDQALANARTHAVAKGVSDPKPNDPIYDLAFMVETLLLGCVDVSSPENAPVLFFDSAEQIRKNMTRDQIVHLFAQHEFFQDQTSPRAKRFENEQQYYAWLVGVAESESPSDFFESIGPALLWSSVRTLIRQLALSQTDKSLVGGTSVSAGSTSTTPSASPSGSSEAPSGG